MEHEDALIRLLDVLAEFERDHNAVERFNLFESVGMARQEIRHSRFLAFLLDPSASHGLEDRFLRSLLMAVIADAPDSPVTRLSIALADLTNVYVYTERDHFDISIHVPSLELLFVIENKIGATESFEQLQTYRERAQTKYKQQRFLGCFLTPEGFEGTDATWAVLSYASVLTLVQRLRESSETLSPQVALAIDHYLELLQRHVVVSDALKAACKKIYSDHRKAIDLIVEHGSVSVLRTAVEFFVQEEKTIARCRTNSTTRENFVALEWQKNPRFQVADEARWSNRCPLQFWFDLQDDKLRLYLEVGPVQDPSFDRTALIQQLRDKGFKPIRKNVTEIYTRVGRWSVGVSDNMDAIEVGEKIRHLWQEFGGQSKLSELTDIVNAVAKLPYALSDAAHAS